VPAGEPGRRRAAEEERRLPLVRLFLYYAVLVLVAVLLIRWVPVVREAFVAPIVPPVLGGELESLGRAAETAARPPVITDPVERAVTTALVIVGTVALVLPVAWVYVHTRRGHFDRALVHSIIVLPVVVAGIVTVVKNSIALAFALAGIVAAVRFRNTLEDPRDAVYIFLALGLGISAGVQALDIALVTSLGFNLIVLFLWRYDVGVGGGPATRNGGVLAVGDTSLLAAGTPDGRRAVRERAAEAAGEMEADGVLVVHTADPEGARAGVEASLARMAKEWRLAQRAGAATGISTLEIPIHFKKRGDPAELLGELEERWPAHIAAAEYVPLDRGDDD